MKGLLTLVGILGFASLFVVIPIGFGLVYGITVSILWGWFVVPLFHLPMLTIPQALGLSLAVKYLTHGQPQVDQTTKEKSVELKTPEEKADAAARVVGALFEPILRALAALGSGWVIHTFFM